GFVFCCCPHPSLILTMTTQRNLRLLGDCEGAAVDSEGHSQQGSPLPGREAVTSTRRCELEQGMRSSEARLQVSVSDSVGLLEVARFALPLCLTCAVGALQATTDAACLGQLLGREALGAAAIANVFQNMIDSVAWAALGVCETLCAEAYGAGSMDMVGVWVQLALCLSTALLLPTFFPMGSCH
ncbi:unnamed protein product, partial [Polarella glacialis]